MSAATHPTTIHPTAVVGPGARIGYGCFIGPYCIIGDEAQLGDGVRLESHCVIDGRTTIGGSTQVFPFVSIGLASQDLKYKGEPSETHLGERNKIREFVTIHRGTAGGGMLTRIGDDCLIMAQAHIAHDCLIGDGVIMANAATLAGHVKTARTLARTPACTSSAASAKRRTSAATRSSSKMRCLLL
jgi:UDP-N-acetylglucosamine acyltransferase